MLPLPMERLQRPQDSLGIRQIRHILRTQHAANQHDIIKRNRHPPTSQRMPHIQRIPQHNQPRRPIRRRRQERIRHRPQPPGLQRG